MEREPRNGFAERGESRGRKERKFGGMRWEKTETRVETSALRILGLDFRMRRHLLLLLLYYMLSS